jgi:hypothetical protein
LRIENGELRVRANPENSESSKNSENSGSDKELKAENGEPRVRGNHERGNHENHENPENPKNSASDKVAAHIDAARLKLIDELSRMILELKRKFPELAQNLERVRDNIPVKQENIPAKNLEEIFNAIRQIINKPEMQEAVRNLVNEAVKILQPNQPPETPPENKLILALMKNDFASASKLIKNIVEQTQLPPVRTYGSAPQPVMPQPQPLPPPPQPISQNIPQPVLQNIPQNIPQHTFQTFQTILNVLQEIKALGVPQELQNAPLKELEAIALQKIGIEVPKNLIKNIPETFSEKPVFATASIKIENPARIESPARIEITPPAKQPDIKQPDITPKEQPRAAAHVAPAPAFEIPLPKNFVQNFTQIFPQIFPQKSSPQIPLPQVPSPQAPSPQAPLPQTPLPQTPLPQNVQKQEIAFSLHKVLVPEQSEPKPILQAWPASVQIPKEERVFWLKTELPLTPQILNIRDAVLSYGKLPENPTIVKLFAEGLHEMSLMPENGKPITKEQANLLWRFLQNSQQPTTQTPPPQQQQASQQQAPQQQIAQTPQTQQPPPQTQQQTTQIPLPPPPLPQQAAPQIPQQATSQVPQQIPQQAMLQIPLQVTHSLLKYQPVGNFEGELFKSLPDNVKKEILRELPAEKAWQPEALQKAIEKIKPNEEFRQILQTFKEQVQWTRIDQDTRPAQDRENVFYFMHNNDLQKGRLKVRDDRKGGGKKQLGSSISFSIKTQTKSLGDINADLVLSKNILNIRMQDSVGSAGKAVEEEREMLAKELADIGISLGELLYGKTPKTRNLPIARAKEESSGLDLRA